MPGVTEAGYRQEQRSDGAKAQAVDVNIVCGGAVLRASLGASTAVKAMFEALQASHSDRKRASRVREETVSGKRSPSLVSESGKVSKNAYECPNRPISVPATTRPLNSVYSRRRRNLAPPARSSARPLSFSAPHILSLPLLSAHTPGAQQWLPTRPPPLPTSLRRIPRPTLSISLSTTTTMTYTTHSACASGLALIPGPSIRTLQTVFPHLPIAASLPRASPRPCLTPPSPPTRAQMRPLRLKCPKRLRARHITAATTILLLRTRSASRDPLLLPHSSNNALLHLR